MELKSVFDESINCLKCYRFGGSPEISEESSELVLSYLWMLENLASPQSLTGVNEIGEKTYVDGFRMVSDLDRVKDRAIEEGVLDESYLEKSSGNESLRNVAEELSARGLVDRDVSFEYFPGSPQYRLNTGDVPANLINVEVEHLPILEIADPDLREISRQVAQENDFKYGSGWKAIS